MPLMPILWENKCSLNPVSDEPYTGPLKHFSSFSMRCNDDSFTFSHISSCGPHDLGAMKIPPEFPRPVLGQWLSIIT
jgi:hypothetical protein